MRKELLFRVFDLITNKYDPNHYKIGEMFGHPSSCDWITEQYTGYTDKNGIKIFEGDIVETDVDHEQYKISQMFDIPLSKYLRGQVRFYRGSFYVAEKYFGATPLYEFLCCDDHNAALKIVGNIHEKVDPK
jgi:uncharacterized phage protein (TIGR01671 family)